MGFGFFKSNKKQSSDPSSSSQYDHSRKLQRKPSRTSAPTNPSPRLVTESAPRALSFDSPSSFYKTLDPRADAGLANEGVKSEGISKGFLDDVLFDFDRKFNLADSTSVDKNERTQGRKYKFDLVDPKPQLQAYTPKVYRLGDSTAKAETTTLPSTSSSRQSPPPPPRETKPAKPSHDPSPSPTTPTEVRSIFRKVKSKPDLKAQTNAPTSTAQLSSSSPRGSTETARYNRHARHNPSPQSNPRSQSRGRPRTTKPPSSSGTESSVSDDDNIPITQTNLFTSRSLSRPPQISPRNQSLSTEKRQPSPIKSLPSPPPSSSSSTDRGQSRSRSRLRHRPITPSHSDDSGSEDNEDTPLAGVRQQAIADSYLRGRRPRNPRAQSVEARAASMDAPRSRSVDVTPGRSSRRAAVVGETNAPPPPTDQVLPTFTPQQQMMTQQQQQQMWAAYYHQAAAYQQAFQQMQQGGNAGMPMMGYPPMMMPYGMGMMPGMVPAQQQLKKKKSLRKKKSAVSLGTGEVVA